MTGIRVIFFDAAGTLIGLPNGVAYHYCRVAGRHGLHVRKEVMNEAFRMTWREMPPPPTTRVRREDDDKSWWRRFVGRVLDKCGVGPEEKVDRDALFEELYVEFARPGVWELFPEARAVLARLSSEYELGIISNFDRRLRVVLTELGVAPLFRHVIISSEVGADKPDPWIFQEALRLAGVRASEALHVGDEPAADWDGATTSGLQVFRLKRPQMTLNHLLETLDEQGR
jgi:putative hydrolase of the HAD superfamily